MRPLRSLLLYVALVFLVGAIIAPWLYWLTQWAAGHASVFKGVAGNPFHRFVNRSLLGLALIGLWPFLRSIHANSWKAVGVVKPAGQSRKLAIGFALGFGSLAGVALLAIVFGARKFNTDVSASILGHYFFKAALSAAVVAALEELLFRGALFGALRRVHPWGVALLASSAVYAIVHFFQRPQPPADVTWSSGLELLPPMLHGFVEMPMLVPGFFVLTLAGMILGLAFQRTENLYCSIGLHAGWIFWLKFYGYLTVARPGGNTWFWGTGKLIDGWLALILLAPVFVIVWFFPQNKATSTA